MSSIKSQKAKNEEYNKQRKRIKQLISRAKKRGYTFPENIIPPKPTKIYQKDINKLKSLTPEKIYAKAKYTDPRTNEIVKGDVGRKREKLFASRKSAYTRKYRNHQKEEVKERIKEEKAKKELDDFLNRSSSPQTLYDDFIKKDSMSIDDYLELKRFKEEAEQKASQLHEEKVKEEEQERIQEIENQYNEQIKQNLRDPDEERRRLWELWEEEKRQEYERRVRKRESQYQSKPVNVTTSILNWVREEINRWTPETNWSKSLTQTKINEMNVLERILNSQIEKDGEAAVAERLEANAEQVKTMVYEVMFSSGGTRKDYDNARDRVNFNLVAFATLLKGESLTVDEAREYTDIMDYLDLDEL